MTTKTCIITGVGPATGTALARRFGQEYKVIMLARDTDRLSALCDELPGSAAYACDLTDTDQLKSTLDTILNDHGTPDVLIHNAVGAAFGNVMTIDPDVIAMNFQINTMAMLHLIQTCGPRMIEAGRGVILATGNTSAYRGKENFAAFAPTKAAQRILLESAARHLGPQGIHACYVAIDGVIDGSQMRDLFPDKPMEFFCQPDDIAEECFRMAHQRRSTWAFDIVIRPDIEVW